MQSTNEKRHMSVIIDPYLMQCKAAQLTIRSMFHDKRSLHLSQREDSYCRVVLTQYSQVCVESEVITLFKPIVCQMLPCTDLLPTAHRTQFQSEQTLCHDKSNQAASVVFGPPILSLLKCRYLIDKNIIRKSIW